MNGNLTVYKASAGSGKTFTLATRCIALLLAAPASSYRHILAVTFTNKATAEMKERILGQLFGLSRGLPSSADYLDTIRPALPGLGDEEIRRRAADVLRRIVHDYDRFRVTTIDSFFQGVVTNMAHELGLSANFRVDINDTDVIDQAVDRLMAGLQPNTAVLRWVIGYIRERIDDNRRWDITREVKRLARNLLMNGAKVHIIIQDAKDGIRNQLYLNNSKRETCMGKAIPIGQVARLKQRCDKINSLASADKSNYKRAIFIHVDSRGKQKRTDVFFYHSKNSLSKRLAKQMKSTFSHKYDTHQPGRGFRGTVGYRGLYVIEHTQIPLTFVELGNIQNSFDQELHAPR